MRVCIKCDADETKVAFTKDRARPDGFHPYCNQCRKGYWKDWAKRNPKKLALTKKRYADANPHYARSSNLKTNHGITPAQ